MKKILMFVAALVIVIAAVTMITVSSTGSNNEDIGNTVVPTSVPEETTEAVTEVPVTYPVIRSITPGSSGFTISWTPYDGAVRYRLFVRGENGWIKVGDTDGTSMKHTALKDQTVYTYTVRGLDSSCKYMSDYLVEGWSKTFRSAPALTSVAASGNALKVGWQKISGAGCYRVYRRQGSSWVGIGWSDRDYYLDTDVESGKTYTYTVRAMEADHTTMLSAFQSPGKSGIFVSMPVITGFASRNSGLRISWDKAEGAQLYRVFIKTASGWKRVGQTSGLYYDYNTSPNGKATYTVRAMNASATAYTSDFIRDGGTHTFLSTPKQLTLTNVDSGQKLSWQKVEGAQLYRIYIKNGSSWKKLADTAALSRSLTGLVSGTSYSYTVRCVSADGKVFQSGYSSSGVTTRYYAAPKITSVENRQSGAVITWGAVKGISKYRVFVRSGSSWKKLSDTDGTKYTHQNVEQGVSYTYTVRGMDAYGSYISGYVASGFKNRYQTAPLITGVKGASDGTALSWETYEGVENYRVYRSVLGGSWSRIADVKGTSYTDRTAPKDVPYHYTLRALDESGNLISDYVAGKTYCYNNAVADGTVKVKGYLVTFKKGTLTKGYLTPQDIIKIAQAEVGTKATNYKRCKYNTWYYGADVSGDYYDWCVVFVEWVFNQAGARDLLFEKTAGAEFFGLGFYQHGQLVKSGYKVGDLVLLHWNPGYSDYVPGVQKLNHVGIIISVNDDGSVTTIEGNTGSSENGEVMIKTRYPDFISCACRPKYGFYIPAE